MVGLSALSYPLSWLPIAWAHFRYDCTLPWPEVVLAAVSLISIGLFLRATGRCETEEAGVTLAMPYSILLPLLAVMSAAVVSIRFSDHPYFGLGFVPRLAGNLGIFLLAVRAPRERLPEFCRWWLIMAVVVAVNGLLRIGFEPEVLSTFGNRNFLGVYLAASVVVGVAIGETWSRLGCLVLLGAMLPCASRGAWLALGAVAVMWFLAFGKGFLRRWSVRVLVVLLMLVGMGWSSRPYVLRQWDTDVRPMIWRATLHMVAARPFLGHGLGSYVVEYPKYRLPGYFLRPKSTNVTDHAHNELLEVAAEQGLVGLAVTLWLWAMAVSCGFRASQQTDGMEHRAVLGILGATLVLMLHGLVDVDLRYLPNQSLLWWLMGLLVGAGAAPVRWRRVTIRSKPARWCLAGICLALGIWIAVAAVSRPVAADLQDRQARIAEERGDLAGAAQHAWEALRLQPFRLSTRYLLAGVLSRQVTPAAREGAIQECQRIEELAPDYADVTYNLGQLHFAVGRTAEALPYLRRAVEINPYQAERRMALAAALHQAGQDDDAMQQLDRILQLQPDNQEAQDLRKRMSPGHHP